MLTMATDWISCPQMSKVGLISIRNETGLADLTLDENDEQHHPLTVSFSQSL